MTPEREAHLLEMAETITEQAELIAFVDGVKENGEWSAAIMTACRGRYKDLGLY